MTAGTWHGRRGSMLLGPTEDRVARYLDSMTRHGRVTIRTVDLARTLRLERSEAYRITARLRMLGLFGVENDQGGALGGRRYWRTVTEREDGRLDAERHRVAWSRIVAWTRARRASAMERLDHIRQAARAMGAARDLSTAEGRSARRSSAVTTYPAAPAHGDAGTGGAGIPPPAPPGAFAEAMRRYGLGPLMDTWSR